MDTPHTLRLSLAYRFPPLPGSDDGARTAAALCARGANPVRAVALCGLRAPALCIRAAALGVMDVDCLLIRSPLLHWVWPEANQLPHQPHRLDATIAEVQPVLLPKKRQKCLQYSCAPLYTDVTISALHCNGARNRLPPMPQKPARAVKDLAFAASASLSPSPPPAKRQDFLRAGLPDSPAMSPRLTSSGPHRPPRIRLVLFHPTFASGIR